MQLVLALFTLCPALVYARPWLGNNGPAAPQPVDPGYKRALKEATLRVKYPEFFNKRDDASPSYLSCYCASLDDREVEYCTWYEGTPPPDNFNTTFDDIGIPVEYTNKRRSLVEGRLLLAPVEAAKYLLGSGIITQLVRARRYRSDFLTTDRTYSENGTTTTDTDYHKVAESRRNNTLKRRNSYAVTKWVRGALGNLVQDLALPIYRRWKRAYADKPGYEFMLSKTVGFQMGDVDDIVKELLKIDGWQEFELAEYRISRRFLELVSQLEP